MSHLIHATAIAYDGRAALIRGPSGAGKSDLALRCLALGPSPLLAATAHLISDDQVVLEARNGQVWASAPGTIWGKLEVRGLGIITVTPALPAPVALVVDLAEKADIERLPEERLGTEILGLAIPRLKLSPFEASAPAKLLLALAASSPP